MIQYPKIVLQSAQNAFSARKSEYEKLTKDKKELLYRKNPQLKTLNDTIAETLRSLVTSELTHKEMKEVVTNLSEMRSEVIKKAGLAENCLETEYFCQKCSDEGFFEGEICSCYSEIIKKEAYNISNLSEKIENENFENFDINLFSNKKEIKFILNTVMKFCEDNGKNNLIFIGTTGTGKTFMSSCVAKYFLDNQKSVLYLSATKISNIINDAGFKKDDQSINADYLNFITDCDLLIVDDLGTEFPLPYPQSQLFDILETRHTKNKKTVISTNLQLDALTQKYSARFTSRLFGNYEILVFNGADMRNNAMY